jgi:hypothetical protein
LKLSEQSQGVSPQSTEPDRPEFQESESTRLRISRQHLRLNPALLVFLEQTATSEDEAGETGA